MFQWLTRMVLYFFLLFRRNEHDLFVQEVTSRGRKRYNRKRVLGIKEKLDEHLPLPLDCYEDLYFAGFTQDGHLASFRIHRKQTEFEIAQVGLLLPSGGSFVYDQVRQAGHGVGKLSLKMLEPMKRWKIDFNGPMEKLEYKDQTEHSVVHVSISLYWQCIEDPYDHWTIPTTWQLAGNVAAQSFRNNIWDESERKGKVWYEQWGEMRGRIEVDGLGSEFMRLKSFRSRKICRVGVETDEVSLSHHIICDGCTLYLQNGCYVQQDHSLRRFGYVTYPIGERWSTEQTSLTTDIVDGSSHSLQYPFTAEAKGAKYDINLDTTRATTLTIKTHEMSTRLRFSKFTVNGKMAFGIQLEETPLKTTPYIIDKTALLVCNSETQEGPLTLKLTDTDCRNRLCVGGKGANLATLNQLGHQVPNGFCVTVEILNAHISNNPQLEIAQQRILDVLHVGEDCKQQLSNACSEAVQLFTETRISPPLTRTIVESLQSTFGEKFSDVSVSVRSSGVSEDGSEASSAGQLETFLGVKGLDSILASISKCWASSFAYRAVEYRRQNGQRLVEPIGVVIQTMVDAAVAGVLFTTDPVTGSTTVMLINASYGLGETVVSGVGTPDTVRVRRGGLFSVEGIVDIHVGEKDKKLVLRESGQVDEEKNDAQDAKKVCLSDEQILNICSIGLTLEERFGCPQDIEWAIDTHGQVHLLQTRPITTSTAETDEELVHEFDTPAAMDTECFTTCNIGEMFPGTGTPLTGSLFPHCISEKAGQNFSLTTGTTYPQYANRIIGICTNKYVMSMTANSIGSVNGVVEKKSDMENFVIGHTVEENTMENITTYKGRRETKLWAIWLFLSYTFFKAKHLVKEFHEWVKQCDTR